MGEPANHLRLAAPADALHLAIGEQATLSDGTPVRRFKRYVIKVGETYRRKGWKKPLVVTEDRAARWLSNAQAMKSNGISTVITKNHEDFRKAENSMGEGVELGREGNWIYSIHDVRGEKNIAIAEANKNMSVEIYPRYVDGRGRVYEDVIPAITYTTVPVVDSQPIAASLNDDVDTYFLSNKEDAMPELLEEIAGILGKKPEEVTTDNAAGLLKSHCDALKLSLDSATTALTAKDAEIKKLSTADAPDTKYLSLAGKLAATKIDGLVVKGALQKSIADELKTLCVGDLEKKEFAPLMLSMHEDEASDKFISKICELFEKNKPVETGDATKGQHLSRQVPDDADPATQKPNPWLVNQ